MIHHGQKSTIGLEKAGINQAKDVHWNLSPSELIDTAVKNGEGVITDTGAFMCDTGTFTGRSPKDRFVVEDDKTRDSVWWGPVNIKISEEHFDGLHQKMVKYLEDKTLYVRDAYAGADEKYRLQLRVINELAWHNLFCNNMFIRPENSDLDNFDPTFTIICAPGFKADPAVDGTRQENFAILNMSKKMILIGGTAYSGEMKKGIFSVLNYLLPHDHGVLSMHCSANIGEAGDTAIFFGLSGTGKTTLSADPNRGLIGDDEHGWTEDSIFNFEGGCYAKVIDLSREKEPQIWDAIREGAIVENTRFTPGTTTVDYENSSVTENTRAAYPIDHISNAVEPSIGGVPKNIFFLTCDAFGVLPPVSRLQKGQAMYHFISGYTAKVAGTEAGITDPVTAFSACFGSPFLPLHPTKYAEMLGRKMEENDVKVWLINTGWSGGPFGVGERMSLKYTRAMITAALNGDLDNVEYHKHEIFGLDIPMECPNVPNEVLDPKNTWEDKNAYDDKANDLASKFVANFEKYSDFANDEIMAGAPKATA